MRLGEAPEVPLAAEAGPLGEDGEREDFARREQGGAGGLRAIRGPLASGQSSTSTYNETRKFSEVFRKRTFSIQASSA